MVSHVPWSPASVQATDQSGRRTDSSAQRSSIKASVGTAAEGSETARLERAGRAPMMGAQRVSTNQAAQDAISNADEAHASEKGQEERVEKKTKEENASKLQKAQAVKKTKETREKDRHQKFDEDAAELQARLSGTTSAGTLRGQLRALRALIKKDSRLRPSGNPEGLKGKEFDKFVNDMAEEFLDLMASREPNLSNRKEVLEFLGRHVDPEDSDDPLVEKALQKAIQKAADLMDRRFGKQIARHHHVREEVVRTLGERQAIIGDERKMRDLLFTLTVKGDSPTSVIGVLEKVGILGRGADLDTLKQNRKTLETIKGYFADHVGMTAKTNQLLTENPVLHLTIKFFRSFNSVVQTYPAFDKAVKNVMVTAGKETKLGMVKFEEYLAKKK